MGVPTEHLGADVPGELPNCFLRDRGVFDEPGHKSMPGVIEPKSDSCPSPRRPEGGAVAGLTHSSLKVHIVNVGHALVACDGYAMKGKDGRLRPLPRGWRLERLFHFDLSRRCPE